MPKSKRVESSDDESEGKTVSPTHSDKSRSRRRTQASREEETIPPLDEDDTGAISLLEKFTGRPRRRGGTSRGDSLSYTIKIVRCVYIG